MIRLNTAAAFAVMIASCSISCNKSEVEMVPLSSDKEICFGPKVNILTKGGNPLGTDKTLDTDMIGDIGVYAGYSGDNTTDVSTVDCTFNMVNARFIRNGEHWYWKGSPARYWPLRGYIAMFAYAPYFADGLTIDSAYEKGMPSILYSPRTDSVTDQTDFCMSEPVIWVDKSSTDTVRLDFNHAVSMINFKANYINELPVSGAKMELETMKIKNIVGKARVKWQRESPYYSWDLTGFGADTTYTLYASKNELNSTQERWVPHTGSAGESASSWVNLTGLNGRLYLIPQTLTADASIEIVWRMCAPNGASLGRFVLETKFPENQVWQGGKIITYGMTIDLKDFTLLDIQASIEDWKSSGNDESDKLIY